MSYPRKLQILVIEDESDPIDAYIASFALLRKSFHFVDPVFARSFDDAKNRIDGPEIFHIVLLDLNLPLATRGQPEQGLSPGEQLLEQLAKRDSYPIPVLLVVSGKLNQANSIASLQERLVNDFWYGRMVNKGPEQHREIETGLNQALRYIDVGIHIRDAGRAWYPTLSPREEDLLRRCVLSSPAPSLGADLRWWSAEEGPSISHPSADTGPTKVLMGHILLDDGFGPSIPTFFKFEPAGNAPFVCRDVGILAQKLGHVKVYHTGRSRQRSLIVTQSVTSHGWPVSLNEFLQLNPVEVEPFIAALIGDVVEQLNHLGSQNEDEVPVTQILWQHLDRTLIDKAWNGCELPQSLKDDRQNPLSTFDHLKDSRAKLWATRRSCTHGDLNATNVAIDTSLAGNPQAYIFDASGMKADLEFRDLATLEVTTILFNSVGLDNQLVHTCRAFYERNFLPAGMPDTASLSPLTRNVCSLISAIRARFQPGQQQRVYAILVFDAAIRQLFGLGVQSSPNKVKNPLHACQLAAWISQWLRNVAPELFTTHTNPGAVASQKTSEIA